MPPCGSPRCGHQDDVHDDALIEFIEDVGDALSDAVTAVVDAVVAIGEAIGSAIAAVVNWTVQQVQDLARALSTRSPPSAS